MRFVAPGHSLVQEVTVREHVFWDIGCDVSLIESRPIQWARVFYSSWARSVKASHLKALSVPDSRGIDSGPSRFKIGSRPIRGSSGSNAEPIIGRGSARGEQFIPA